MNSYEKVIFIKGIGDKPEVQNNLPEAWAPLGLEVIECPIDYTATDYQLWLQETGDYIEWLADSGNRVSAVGSSGGGKPALSLLARDPKSMHRVVTINSKVEPYDLDEEDRQKLQNLVLTSDMFPEYLDRISGDPKLLSRILCIRTEGDKTVKPEDATIDGARSFTIAVEPNETTETKLHIAGIAKAITKHAVVIAEHIRQD